jgi:hypothetical protein
MVVVTENHRDVNCVPGLQVIGYSQPTWLLGGGQDARRHVARASCPEHRIQSHFVFHTHRSADSSAENMKPTIS